MKNEEIRKLLLSLPDDSPYLEEIRRRFFPHKKVLSLDDRLVFALRDPAFEYHFAAAYARAKHMLPPEVCSWSIWRIYSLLRYKLRTLSTDFAGLEARALAHPSNRGIQALLKGLLCACKDYKEVAERSGISVEVIELYSRWYFDFLSRRDDERFVMPVLNPKCELNLFTPERTQDSVLLSIRVGYRLGAEALLWAHGRTVDQNGNADKSASIKQVLLTDVEIKAKLRMLDAGDPDFIYFKALSVVEAKHQSPFESDDDRMGFGRISSDRGAQLVIRQITQRGALHKLRLAQEYDAREAAAAQVKRKAAEGVAGDGESVAQIAAQNGT